MTQTDLSRAIAATGDEWQRAGVRVTNDGPNGFRLCYRNCNKAWLYEGDDFAVGHSGRATAFEKLQAAIASGPDWQDDATAGVLLGMMPMVRITPTRMAACCTGFAVGAMKANT